MRAFNEVLNLILSALYVLGIVVHYSLNNSSRSLYGLLTTEGVCCMLEARNYRQVEYVLLFVAALINKLCGEKTA